MRIIEEGRRDGRCRSLVVSPSLPPNLIVDSSYQGRRSSSRLLSSRRRRPTAPLLLWPPGAQRGGSGLRSPCLLMFGWEIQSREAAAVRQNLFRVVLPTQTITRAIWRVRREEGELDRRSELLKGLRRFTLRRYDWIMSASLMSRPRPPPI